MLKIKQNKKEKNMLDIVYEDNHILVVIKPQNIPTQLDSSKDEDLLTMCKNYIKEKYNKPGEAYVGMVQRLDRPTGGLMVFAKTSKAAERLCEKMKNGELHKKYLTVVCGNPHFKKDNLKHYLKKESDKFSERKKHIKSKKEISEDVKKDLENKIRKLEYQLESQKEE